MFTELSSRFFLYSASLSPLLIAPCLSLCSYCICIDWSDHHSDQIDHPPCAGQFPIPKFMKSLLIPFFSQQLFSYFFCTKLLATIHLSRVLIRVFWSDQWILIQATGSDPGSRGLLFWFSNDSDPGPGDHDSDHCVPGLWAVTIVFWSFYIVSWLWSVDKWIIARISFQSLCWSPPYILKQK